MSILSHPTKGTTKASWLVLRPEPVAVDGAVESIVTGAVVQLKGTNTNTPETGRS